MNNLECNNGKLSFKDVKDKINEIIAYFSNYFTKTESDSRFLSKSNVTENNIKFLRPYAKRLYGYTNTDNTTELIQASSGKYIVFYSIWRNGGDDDDFIVRVTEGNGGSYNYLDAISPESGVGLGRSVSFGVAVVENIDNVAIKMNLYTDGTKKFTGYIKLFIVKVYSN